MRYGSVCSGIEAATVAWKPLGWSCAFVSEIEPFPCAVLAHHYPDAANLGDITRISEADLDRTGPIDLLVGGTPCQSFSVAGLRAGMDDPRGNLALVFLGLAERARPRWVVWENVPGVLSSNEGRDFGALVTALGQLGYGWAYRILDAQYFGVAQRRRRVFLVGCSGGWAGAVAVLFERSSLCGHPPPSREARPRPAGPLASGSAGGSGYRNDADTAESLIVPAMTTRTGTGTGTGTGRDGMDDYCVPSVAVDLQNIRTAEKCGTIQEAQATGNRGYGVLDRPAVSFRAAFSNQGMEEDLSPTLDSEPMAVASSVKAHHHGGGTGPETTYATDRMRVRRLTPRECERLQGFPDDYTLIPYRGKPAKDAPRYRALGNSMAVPVMRWIGERIAAVDAYTALLAAEAASRAEDGGNKEV